MRICSPTIESVDNLMSSLLSDSSSLSSAKPTSLLPESYLGFRNASLERPQSNKKVVVEIFKHIYSSGVLIISATKLFQPGIKYPC